MGKNKKIELNRSTFAAPKSSAAYAKRSLGRARAVPLKRAIRPVKIVAIFQALEGLLALAAASGFFLLLGKDLDTIVQQLVQHMHLNPAARYPNIIITAVDHLENTKFTVLAIGSIAYALFRFVEAYGLFREAAWAELIAAFSSAIYLPIEVMAIFRKVSLMSVGVLAVNIAVVVITVLALVRKRRSRKRIYYI